MKSWRGAERTPSGWGRSVVTIGMYDGVHRGHQHLLETAVRRAHAAGLSSVAVTFDPHPSEVVRPGSHPPILTSVNRKAELLAGLGLDALCVLPFTAEFSRLLPDEFVHSALVAHLHAATVVVGENFRFGHRAQGSVETLRELGERFGFQTDSVGIQRAGEFPLSSTYIRACVAAGDMIAAAAALGRLHRVEGIVVRGDRRGRELGYPTANVECPVHTAIPADGVYAGRLIRDGKPLPAAISVGTNPTFSGEQRRVEAFVLDFAEDVYGEHVAVEFVSRLRRMERFDKVKDLIKAMDGDVARTRQILAETEHRPDN
ncbi:MAG: bifunctional riboflavin kinase/FAD synthetase [Geodermatophilaceae bacterium]|nr:bifunctional riboflavin kinase/FAD synthetase [Geodermatophilaceae bacterium]